MSKNVSDCALMAPWRLSDMVSCVHDAMMIK